MDIKTLSAERADIYKAILSGKGFKNPMTNYIISLKHSLILLSQYLDDKDITIEIEATLDTVESFKNHTDNISGLNLNSSKKIYEILDVIEKLNPYNASFINYYKLCLGSILNNDNIKKNITEFNYYIFSILLEKENKDYKKISSKLNKINNMIKEQIFSDNLAFENIKLELSTRSLNCSLSSMLYKTKQNIILSDIHDCPTFNDLLIN